MKKLVYPCLILLFFMAGSIRAVYGQAISVGFDSLQNVLQQQKNHSGPDEGFAGAG